MKNNKRVSFFSKVFDSLTGSKDNAEMLDLNITPKKFVSIKEQYDAALRARQQDILYLHREKGWTQQKIADYYQIDISAVNRIIRKIETREE